MSPILNTEKGQSRALPKWACFVKGAFSADDSRRDVRGVQVAFAEKH
jgi:hypothetical protein